MPGIFEKIIDKADEIEERIIKFRREIHSNPELSGDERNTAAFVAGVLEANDIEVRRGVGGHGVVGVIKGRKDEPVIAIRADMDALPIQDRKDVEYSSIVPGVMHACGHDVHTAILMGTAIILSSLKENLQGSVKLIFQPAEEKVTGAGAMIEAGVLENPAPSAIVALHCFPEMESGTVGHREGMMTAAADRIHIVVKGKSGHASRPHQTVDAVLVSSMVINAIHHIVSRRTDPLLPSVISIGTISGGTAENIIADRVEMTGTVRTLDPEQRVKMPVLIETVIKGVCISVGATYEFDYSFDCPPVNNDEGVNELVRKCAADLLGEGAVVRLPEPMMGSEDFALFTEKVPGALFRLGTGNREKGISSHLHSSDFDVDEDSLVTGAKIMSLIAARYLDGDG